MSVQGRGALQFPDSSQGLLLQGASVATDTWSDSSLGLYPDRGVPNESQGLILRQWGVEKVSLHLHGNQAI